MSGATAQLHLRDTPTKRVTLQPSLQLTIGQAGNNRLTLVSLEGVSPHHAVVRFNASHGWMVCDWQSSDGTYLEGERVRRCRPLSDGDEIRLGLRGPVLVFSLTTCAAPEPASPRRAPTGATSEGGSAGASEARSSGGSGRRPSPPKSIDIDGTTVPLNQIRSAVVLSEPLFPHIFSWWLLTSLGGLLLLPFPLLFWPLELAALAGWILLGSRKSHTLLVVLHDGRAQRRQFANRVTALAHRNGIRKAIGQSLQQP
ncbi:FHA domain-containing protein [Cyanobium sp. BA20m-p-22]|uniref:FHA domain-containing protein n=1 Tax=Cyanobium sp. BA20m-p-22 TaxID=2823704 RepID=UPI0020CE818A|nr:FHA domain-containing protein [Cyanobium sp. BA20m-p-22]MCP9911662.1 FHA domain-containing protein [Cyanobium sp. BA20m-p-22]